MNKKVIGVFLLLAVVLSACQTATPTPPPADAQPTVAVDLTTAPHNLVDEAIYKVEPFAYGLIFPTDIEFAKGTDLLYVAEKNGTVKTINPKGEISAPVISLTNIDISGERGLLGLAFDPKYTENGYLYVFYTVGDQKINRISRFTVKNGQGSDEQMVFEFPIAFEQSTILNGGGLDFGPDGMLYIGAGSTNNIYAANDPTKNARIHRLDVSSLPAQIPPDNPDPNNSAIASGLRNIYDLAFQPVTGRLYATENGGDCDDEIVWVNFGWNHGWYADGLCEDNNLPADYKYQRPLLYFTPTISPTGIMFYQGDVFPEWQNNLFFCSWHVGKLIRLEMGGGDDPLVVKKAERIETGSDKLCSIDVTSGADGNIYYSDVTSIYRVVRNK